MSTLLNIVQSKRQATTDNERARYREILASGDASQHADELIELTAKLGIDDRQFNADVQSVSEYRNAKASADAITSREMDRLRTENDRACQTLSSVIQRHRRELKSAQDRADAAHAALMYARDTTAERDRMRITLERTGRGWIAAE